MKLSDRLSAAQSSPLLALTNLPDLPDTASPERSPDPVEVLDPAGTRGLPGDQAARADSVTSASVTPETPAEPGAVATRSASTSGSTAAAHQSPTDALTLMKERATTALFQRLGARLSDSTLSETRLHALVRRELNRVVEEEKVPLTPVQRQRLIAEVEADVLGHGPLQGLLDDESVTEIMVNGPDRIYVEQNGQLTLSSARFGSEAQLRGVI
ncbi:MAG: CpaF family protein, partial [Ornithinimicrobium sp.]